MLTCKYIYFSVSICVYTCIITYETIHAFQLLAALLTIYIHGYTHNSICVHTSTHLYTHISMYTYFHIFTHHIYIHFSDSESLKWQAFSISTIWFYTAGALCFLVCLYTFYTWTTTAAFASGCCIALHNIPLLVVSSGDIYFINQKKYTCIHPRLAIACFDAVSLYFLHAISFHSLRCLELMQHAADRS